MRRLILLAFLAPALADSVLLPDGRALAGRVEALTFAVGGERRVLARADVTAVHLDTDRERTDLIWIEHNLRFALGRRGGKPGDIGVYADRGAFPPSTIAIVRRLEEKKLRPRLLFAGDFADQIPRCRAVVFPGGWAPSMLAALGPRGQAALRDYVRGGGRYLGVCAGAYLPCETATWAGEAIPYPVRLVPGRAVQALPDLGMETAALDMRAGKKTVRAVHAGGCALEVKDAPALARYPGGGAAVVLVGAEKGRVLLAGTHFEFDGKRDADLLAGWADGVAAGDGRYFKDLVARLLR